MAALCNRGAIIFLPSSFFLSSSSSSFSSPNLSGHRLDVYHTSTHGVALVNLYSRIASSGHDWTSVNEMIYGLTFQKRFVGDAPFPIAMCVAQEIFCCHRQKPPQRQRLISVGLVGSPIVP